MTTHQINEYFYLYPTKPRQRKSLIPDVATGNPSSIPWGSSQVNTLAPQLDIPDPVHSGVTHHYRFIFWERTDRRGIHTGPIKFNISQDSNVNLYYREVGSGSSDPTVTIFPPYNESNDDNIDLLADAIQSITVDGVPIGKTDTISNKSTGSGIDIKLNHQIAGKSLIRDSWIIIGDDFLIGDDTTIIDSDTIHIESNKNVYLIPCYGIPFVKYQVNYIDYLGNKTLIDWMGINPNPLNGIWDTTTPFPQIFSSFYSDPVDPGSPGSNQYNFLFWLIQKGNILEQNMDWANVIPGIIKSDISFQLNIDGYFSVQGIGTTDLMYVPYDEFTDNFIYSLDFIDSITIDGGEFPAPPGAIGLIPNMDHTLTITAKKVFTRTIDSTTQYFYFHRWIIDSPDIDLMNSVDPFSMNLSLIIPKNRFPQLVASYKM